MPLAELSGVEPRLLTRLEGGLVVELPPPDRELRQQLVERTPRRRGGQEPDAELVTYIASRPAESARAVQGYVQRVLHSADSQQAQAERGPGARGAGGRRARGAQGQPRRVASISVAAAVVGRRQEPGEDGVGRGPTLSDRVIEEWR